MFIKPISRLKTYTCIYSATCAQVSDLISKIQAAYVETLEELSWMDTPSKEKAREKVIRLLHFVLQRMIRIIVLIVLHHFQAMAIKEHIGYPDHILQEANQKLDQEYAHVSKSQVSTSRFK